MDLTARFPSPLAAAAAAAAAGQNAVSASTASSLFPYLFSNRNLHNYWLSTMKGMNDFITLSINYLQQIFCCLSHLFHIACKRWAMTR
jgi:hypothetical protein